MTFCTILRFVPICILAAACSATPNIDAGDSRSAETTITTIAETFHIEQLDGTTSNLGKTWTAEILVTVVDSNDQPVVGADVSGSWDLDQDVGLTCQTQENGQCTLATEPIEKSVKYATLHIESVEYPGLIYRAEDDHDPDSITEGTSIRVRKT